MNDIRIIGKISTTYELPSFLIEPYKMELIDCFKIDEEKEK